MRTKYLFWVIVALNALDALLTLCAVNTFTYEANPIVAFGMRHFGDLGGLYVIKAIPLVSFGIILYFFWDRVSAACKLRTNRILAAVAVLFVLLNVYSLVNMAAYVIANS